MGRAFNRTSMESKRVQARSMRGHVTLLIEPVWNRNESNGTLSVRASAFNRTSMESKPPAIEFDESKRTAFNRTSMESKH